MKLSLARDMKVTDSIACYSGLMSQSAVGNLLQQSQAGSARGVVKSELLYISLLQQ